VEDFLLYDFFTPGGDVDENVFAYSNRSEGERALVVFNNRYGDTSGWIRMSVGYLDNASGQGAGIRQRSLAEGLDLHPGEGAFITFSDHITGLEYIRSSQEIAEKGLFLDLLAYQTHVFLNIREIQDDARGSYARLNARLNGRGVPSLDDALAELFLEPVLTPFREAVHPGFFSYILDSFKGDWSENTVNDIREQMDIKLTGLLRGLRNFNGYDQNGDEISHETLRRLETFLSIMHISHGNPLPGSKTFAAAAADALAGFTGNPERQAAMLGWLTVHDLGKAAGRQDFGERGLAWFEELRMDRALKNTFQTLGYDNQAGDWMLDTIRMLICVQTWSDRAGNTPPDALLQSWMHCPEVRRFLGVNAYEGALWFNQERFEVFLWWLGVLAAVDAGEQISKTSTEWAEMVNICQKVIERLRAMVPASDYQIEKMIELAGEERPPKPKVTRPRKR
jgi:hypothetical protein